METAIRGDNGPVTVGLGPRWGTRGGLGVRDSLCISMAVVIPAHSFVRAGRTLHLSCVGHSAHRLYLNVSY